MKRLNLTMTLSLSLNCQLSDRGRSKTFMLPLAWVTMPLDGWRRLAQQVQTGLNSALFGAMVWGVG